MSFVDLPGQFLVDIRRIRHATFKEALTLEGHKLVHVTAGNVVVRRFELWSLEVWLRSDVHGGSVPFVHRGGRWHKSHNRVSWVSAGQTTGDSWIMGYLETAILDITVGIIQNQLSTILIRTLSSHFDAQLGGSRSSRNPEEQSSLGLVLSIPCHLFAFLSTSTVQSRWGISGHCCLKDAIGGADLSDLPRFQGYAQLMTFYGALLISGWIGMICHYAACQIMPVLMVDLRCFAWSQFPEAFSRAPLIKQDEGGHLENGSRKKCTYTSCVNAFKVIKGPIRSVHSCRPGILGTFIGYWVSSSDVR